MKRITPIETIRRRFSSADFSSAETSDTPSDPCLPSDDIGSVTVPQRIEALIAQRQATHDKVFRPIPLPGQIVRVPPRQNRAGSFFNEYLAVLLDAEIALGKWRGWLVGRDTDYAGMWDLVLGPEDEPRDPVCQLVQVWNPVALSLQEADRVLAELTPERLAAIRTLARDHEAVMLFSRASDSSTTRYFTIEGDHVQKLIPTPTVDNRLGVHLARELSDGTGVVTGTLLAAQNDPRTEYQRLYRDAALWLGSIPLPAFSASTMPEQEASPLLHRWFKTIFDFRGGNWLKPAVVFATLIIVPLLIVEVLRDNPEQTHDSGNVYISGSGIREIRTEQPLIKAQELEDRLRATGATPEIRHEAGGTIAIQVDLAPLTEADRAKFLAAYGLAVPADMQLRLLIVPAEKGMEKGRP